MLGCRISGQRKVYDTEKPPCSLRVIFFIFENFELLKTDLECSKLTDSKYIITFLLNPLEKFRDTRPLSTYISSLEHKPS